MFKNIIEKFFKCFKKEESKNEDIEESLEKVIEILNFYKK